MYLQVFVLYLYEYRLYFKACFFAVQPPCQGTYFQRPVSFSLSSLPVGGTNFQKPGLYLSIVAWCRHCRRRLCVISYFIVIVCYIVFCGYCLLLFCLTLLFVLFLSFCFVFSGIKQAVPVCLNVSKLRNQRYSDLFKFACFGVCLRRFEDLKKNDAGCDREIIVLYSC